MESDYDKVGWIKSKENNPLSDFLLKLPIQYNYFFTDYQLYARSDQFKRYGTDHSSLIKIVIRVSSMESLFGQSALKGGMVRFLTLTIPVSLFAILFQIKG